MDIVLHDSTFLQLCEFIYDRTGIHIPPTKKYLVENRLIKVIEDNNLKGFDEFLYTLKYSSNGREVDRLYDAITTNETYFFREPQQFDIFIDNIVPRVLEHKNTLKDIRVWSAACSTGEEPYTISMVMSEKRSNLRTDILASDISGRVLDSAKKGLYSSYSVRNVPKYYLDKYFKNKDRDYLLDTGVRNSVVFRSVNLVDEKKMSEQKGFDVIFCRNVLIYFDDRAKQKVVSLLYDSLRPGGFLFIGSSESLHNVTRAFRPITLNKVVVYEKVS
jgi:chemotaxis protein methyltransferase CheR